MNIKEKLTSRKFWMTAVSTVTGVAQIFGADDSITALIGAVLTLVPSVIYVIIEGRLDAAKLTDIVKSVKDELNTEIK